MSDSDDYDRPVVGLFSRDMSPEPQPTITIWHGIAVYADPAAEMQARIRVRDYLEAFGKQRPDAEQQFVKNLGRETVRAALGREPR